MTSSKNTSTNKTRAIPKNNESIKDINTQRLSPDVMVAVQGQKESGILDDGMAFSATNDHAQVVSHQSKSPPNKIESHASICLGECTAVETCNEVSGCLSKQQSPVVSVSVQVTTTSLPNLLQQPLLQDNISASSFKAKNNTKLSCGANVHALPQVVKKGRFTVVQETLTQLSNQQLMERTTSTATQVQKGRFTVTLDSSVSIEGETLTSKIIPGSTTSINSSGTAKTVAPTSNVLHNPTTGITHSVAIPETAVSQQPPPPSAPPIVKKKGRFVVTSAAASSSVLPISQGSTVASTDTTHNPALQIQNEGVSVPSPISQVQNETVSIPTMVTAVPQVPIEPLGESPRVQGGLGTQHTKVTGQQGVITNVQNPTEKTIINSKIAEDHHPNSTLSNNKAVSMSSKPTGGKCTPSNRSTNGKPPASFDSKGIGSAVGLGKMFHYLEQMKGEVSEADRTLKVHQKEVKFLKDRNKELEQKCREMEKRWKEEKMIREASENKVRNLKKKIKDLKESIQNQSQPQATNGNTEKIFTEENTSMRKSLSQDQMADLLKQPNQSSKLRVCSTSMTETNSMGDTTIFIKRADESPSRKQSRRTNDEQLQSSDHSSNFGKTNAAAVQSLPVPGASKSKSFGGSRDSSQARHSHETLSSASFTHGTLNCGHIPVEETKTTSSRSDSNHRRHTSATSLQTKNFGRVNSSGNTEESIPIMNTSSCVPNKVIMPNNPTSIMSSNIGSLPLSGTQSMTTAKKGHVSIIAMQTQQQQQQKTINAVQQNLMNGQQIMAGQQQQNQQIQSIMSVNTNQQQWNNQGQFHSNSMIQPTSINHTQQQMIGQSMMKIMPNNNGHTGMQQPTMLSQGISQQQGFLQGQKSPMQTAMSQQANLQQGGQLQVMSGKSSSMSICQQQQQYSSQQQQNHFSQTQQHSNIQW
mmetsp:Transcript_12186/g.13971  ORF Transcript_12186/g.13971 Transcript_12186/m.13971 type:complete len:923 (-) Transcript_12186:152-2920(-)